MAIFFDAPVEPDDLTVFVRQVPMPPVLALSQLFPTRFVDRNSVDFMEIVHTNRTAKYRSYDGRLSVSKRDTATEKFVKLPPLSSSLEMGEYERLQLEFARTGGIRQQVLAQSIYNDAERLVGEIHNRIELAWGDVLTDGILSINENGLTSTADFGVPANQLITAGTAWTNLTGSHPLSDMITAVDVYVALNGFAPGSVITSLRNIRNLCQNTEIINAIKGATGAYSRVTLQEVNDLLTANGLPTILPHYDLTLDVDGTTTRVIAQTKVVFLPPDPSTLGYMAYGVTATALELVNSSESDLSFEEAPGIVGVVEKIGPPYRQTTFVDAVGMPVLTNAKRLMVLEVG